MQAAADRFRRLRARATDSPKGRAGIEYGRRIGGSNGTATIIGSADRANPNGAAFANGELINTLDYDAVLPPGHVTPYVLPGALAAGEELGVSGRTLIVASAVAHEMSFRIGKAMDYLRDTSGGKVTPPEVYGYSSTVFGATAAIARTRGLGRAAMADALGIAGCISPVNSQVAWFQHAPSSTIKYLLAGALTQAAFTASFMAELGHRGDPQVLDDRQFGFPRFIGTKRWEPDSITLGLGTEWRFPAEQSYKPYPHCRIMHALFGSLEDIIDQHGLKLEEIDGIKAYIEGFAEQPVWTNRTIGHVHDAQFSMAHGIAVAAHRVPPGKAWLDPEFVTSPSVMNLMAKVTTEVHPDYVKLLTSHGASRPARIELTARGQTFVAERRYPKGSPSPEPGTAMTNEELIAKFRHNAEGVIAPAAAERFVEMVMGLEQVADIGTAMRLLAVPAALARAAE